MSDVTDRVSELQLAVKLAKDRVAEYDEARRAGARRVERARAELMEFYRQEGRGDTDDELRGVAEAGLQEALRKAEGGLTPRTVAYPLGAGQSEVRLEPVDEAAEARYEGAVEALAEAEAELRQYVAGHLVDIAVARAPMAGQIRDECAAALAAARKAAASFERMRGGWAELLVLADREDLLADIPENPLRWTQGAGEAVLPMPESFTG